MRLAGGSSTEAERVKDQSDEDSYNKTRKYTEPKMFLNKLPGDLRMKTSLSDSSSPRSVGIFQREANAVQTHSCVLHVYNRAML